jgi:hypothetical protein
MEQTGKFSNWCTSTEIDSGSPTRLALQSCPPGAEELAEALRQNTKLDTLDLANNQHLGPLEKHGDIHRILWGNQGGKHGEIGCINDCGILPTSFC